MNSELSTPRASLRTAPQSLAASVLGHLDEAVRTIELRRYRRIMTSGRLPTLYVIGVLVVAWVLVPFLFSSGGVMAGRDPMTSHAGWAPGVLLAVSALATALGGFLRTQHLWNEERRLRTHNAWLLTRQQPVRVAVTIVVMAAVLGVELTAFPAGIALLWGLLGGMRWWQILLEPVLLALCGLSGAAMGAAAFFIGQRLVRSVLYYPPMIALALFVVGLWARVESVQHGWTGRWEEHAPRIVTALAVISPVPALFGTASPVWWSRHIEPGLGMPLPAWGGALLYALFLLIVTACAAGLAVEGYLALARDPEHFDRKATGTLEEEGGREFYWQGFRNPVLTRDIRTRLRAKDTAEFIFFAAAAVAAGAFIPLLLTVKDLSDPLQTSHAAKQVFFWLTMTLVALVGLIGPSLTADTITQERSQGTLELLVATPLRPEQILAGKLQGAVAVLLLLITPSLPLFSLCYLFHGADAGQVVGVYVLLLVTLTVSAFVGLAQSAIQNRAGMAKFWAYACVACFLAFPGGPFWLAAFIAGRQADLAWQIPFAAMMGLFGLVVLGLFWGNAREQLEYSEY